MFDGSDPLSFMRTSWLSPERALGLLLLAILVVAAVVMTGMF